MKTDPGITPLEFKVLVRPDEEKGFVELKGGHKLWKPDETKERDKHASVEGTLVAIAEHAFTYEAGVTKPPLGARVIFARYSGITCTGRDGREYRLMNDKDLVAVRHE